MKYVDITNQEIVEGFKKSCPLFVGEEIEELHSLSDTLISKIVDAVKEYKSQVVK